MNSLVIVLFLSGMVAMIMLRTLHKDIARYNQVDQVKEANPPIHNTTLRATLYHTALSNTHCSEHLIIPWDSIIITFAI